MKIKLLIFTLLFSSIFFTSVSQAREFEDRGEWQQNQIWNFGYVFGLGKYKVYIPSTFDQQKEKKLVMLLHGCMQTPEAFLRSSRFDKIAEKNGFAVVMPMQPANANKYNCWNWYAPINQVKSYNPFFAFNEMDIVLKIVDKVKADLNIKKRNTFAVGMSAGAGMLNNLANCYPYKFNAVALHHSPAFLSSSTAWYSIEELTRILEEGSDVSPEQTGVIGYQCAISGIHGAVQRPIPTIIFHGTKGQMNYLHAEHVAAEFYVLNDLLHNGLRDNSIGSFSQRFVPSERLYDYDIFQVDYKSKPLIVRYKIHGLGHAWSGGDNNWEFNDPHGPNASKAIEEFFIQHGL